jgi:hypothetical protein
VRAAASFKRPAVRYGVAALAVALAATGVSIAAVRGHAEPAAAPMAQARERTPGDRPSTQAAAPTEPATPPPLPPDPAAQPDPAPRTDSATLRDPTRARTAREDTGSADSQPASPPPAPKTAPRHHAPPSTSEFDHVMDSRK